jgi:isopenicillin N synthase-like dioxygenase
MNNHVIPVLDISPFVNGNLKIRIDVARALGRAFEESGFVALVGHPIPETLIQSTYSAAEAFFAMPLAAKMQFALPKRALNRGYLPIGVESVATTLTGKTPPDLCEAYVFKSLYQEARQSHVPADERWRNIWPSYPAEFAKLATEYFWAADNLAIMLHRMTALALDLPEDYFEPFFSEHWSTLRFANYPDQPTEPLPGQLRYGAHHDYGAFTILRQDMAPGGLQICDKVGSWHDVPAIPESFIINIGDLLARWTNDRWRSTLHRVINPSRKLTGSTQRLSIVVFNRPDDAAEIACLPTCCDAMHPAKYDSVNARMFTQGKMEMSALEHAR